MIDPLSLSAVKIKMHFNETQLSSGTAFFWKKDDSLFLVTNWHNISGRNSITGKCLSSTQAIPNRIVSDIYIHDEGRAFPRNLDIRWPLEGPTNWWQHPTGAAVDVVVMPVPDQSAIVMPVNLNAINSLKLFVGDDVSILGYPRAVDINNFPIWKKGTVASEPSIDFEGQPKLLVDTASISGMSGSPVIAIKSSGEANDGSTVFVAGRELTIVGVYSGRLVTDGVTDTQLGIVWKEKVLHEIVASKIPYENT